MQGQTVLTTSAEHSRYGMSSSDDIHHEDLAPNQTRMGVSNAGSLTLGNRTNNRVESINQEVM